MSQNILATAFWRGRQGSIVNVVGSGNARISLSLMRANPSMAAPSNPTPCSMASSRSSTVMAKPFRCPRMSVNHRRMNLTSFSWAVRTTKSRSAARSASMCVLHTVPMTSFSYQYTGFTRAPFPGPVRINRRAKPEFTASPALFQLR